MEDEIKKFLLVFNGRQYNKDLINLMKCLQEQNKDNKAILYESRNIKKVILPVEEYHKMCQRLEAIENVLEIIKKHPFESAATINYIKINKDNPKMLDYNHYYMSLDAHFRVPKPEFELLKENENE